MGLAPTARENFEGFKQRGFPDVSDDKDPACNAGDPGSIPGSKVPCRREWLPTPVFLPGEFRGQRWATVQGFTKSRTQLSD